MLNYIIVFNFITLFIMALVTFNSLNVSFNFERFRPIFNCLLIVIFLAELYFLVVILFPIENAVRLEEIIWDEDYYFYKKQGEDFVDSILMYLHDCHTYLRNYLNMENKRKFDSPVSVSGFKEVIGFTPDLRDFFYKQLHVADKIKEHSQLILDGKLKFKMADPKSTWGFNTVATNINVEKAISLKDFETALVEQGIKVGQEYTKIHYNRSYYFGDRWETRYTTYVAGIIDSSNRDIIYGSSKLLPVYPQESSQMDVFFMLETSGSNLSYLKDKAVYATHIEKLCGCASKENNVCNVIFLKHYEVTSVDQINKTLTSRYTRTSIVCDIAQAPDANQLYKKTHWFSNYK